MRAAWPTVLGAVLASGVACTRDPPRPSTLVVPAPSTSKIAPSSSSVAAQLSLDAGVQNDDAEANADPSVIADDGAAAPPLTLEIGKETLFVEQRQSDEGFVFVSAIRFSERTLLPASCSEKPALLPTLCSGAFDTMGEHEDYKTQLVDHHESAGVATLLFTARVEGSSECGAYGYWVLRVDSKGAKASTPVKGCFAYEREPGLTPPDWTPDVKWGPPLKLLIREESGAVRRVKLNGATFEWEKS